MVQGYLRTTESVYRVLHIPSFCAEYEKVWTDVRNRDPAFIVQLKLVMAIGAFTYDDHFSLRASATRWIYEGCTWLAEPGLKSRLNLQTLQSNVLLALAQEIVDVGGDMFWISAGSLLHSAIFMGFHRDPVDLEAKTVLAVEMRRRLWNTILELSLQSSINSGTPTLVDIESFNTRLPLNLNDADLTSEDCVVKAETEWTDMSAVRAFGETFRARLAVAQHLNDGLFLGSYEDTTRLDSALREAYKALCRSLQSCSHRPNRHQALFALRAYESILQRYFLVLHAPYIGRATRDTVYAFSRQAAVDAALKMQTTLSHTTTSSPLSRQDGDMRATQAEHDFAKLVLCGSGFFRTGVMQAASIIGFELLQEAQENSDNLGPVTVRLDLMLAIEGARDWSLRCIRAGDMNIKVYMLIIIICESIAAYKDRCNRDEAFQRLRLAKAKAISECQDVLQRMVDSIEPEVRARSENGQSHDSPEGMDVIVCTERLF